jgi:hypothetical protein
VAGAFISGIPITLPKTLALDFRLSKAPWLNPVGCSDAVKLETHLTGGGTREASTRRSWDRMKTCLTGAEVEV